jgi:N utilization substance protein B
MTRSQARCHAFILVFQFPFHPFDIEGLAQAKMLYYDGLENDERPKGKHAAYIERAVIGTWDRLAQIDGVVMHFLKNWTIERINKIDLALLRLCIYEMLCEKDVPVGVAINEAVTLSKQYGSDESPAFINGVLGGISRELDKNDASI